MTIKNIIYATLVAIIWGMNFISVKFAFQEVPPFLFLTLRFIFTILPMIFFVPKPGISWRMLIWIGLFQWVLHFSLLFSALYLGVPVGISSLLAQSQIIFTIFFACLIFKSRLTMNQILGIGLSFVGLILIALQGGIDVNWLGYVLILGGALAIGVTNILYRQIPSVNMVSLAVWSTVPAIPPMIVLTYMIEGWDVIQYSIMNMSRISMSCLVFTVGCSTFIGFTIWAKLMNRCDPAKVAPFALLVPVVAMTASCLILEEVLSQIDIIASCFILGGLLINQLQTLKRPKPTESLPTPLPLHDNEDVKEAA